MKPSEKQKKVISIIQSQLSFWENTNDINSPTHECDIDEEINLIKIFDDVFNEFEAENLKHELYDLYYYIRNIKG